LKESENRVWRRKFGPKREEERGGLKRLHNKELHNTLLFTITLLWCSNQDG
jgi:hypothetical protein